MIAASGFALARGGTDVGRTPLEGAELPPASPLKVAALVPTSGVPATDRRAGLITITPGSSTLSNDTLLVTIDMCAYDASLDESTFEVWRGPDNVTANFTIQWLAFNPACYDGLHGQARATGTIILSPGDNLVGAIIYDVNFDDIDGMPVTYNRPLPSVETPGNVMVTPDGQPIGVDSGSALTGKFWVINPRPEARSIAVARACSGQASCTASSTTHSIAAKDSLAVNVSYAVSGSWLQTGQVRVIGTDQGNSAVDTGTVDVTVGPAAETTLPAIVGPDLVRRDLCLRIAAGAAGAIECGDLRMDHPLPQTVVMGVGRTPILTYSSQHASPFVLVSENVTVSVSEALPATVNAKLFVNSVEVDSRSWAGTQWASPGQTRRITTRLDAGSHATGVYPFVLEVRRGVGGTLIKSTTGELVVVNRSQSAFGAGWALAGLDTLIHLAGSRKLVIGGGGRAQIFTFASTTVWTALYTAPRVDGADSLAYDGTYYYRLLPDGGRVVFTAAGAHSQTRGRLAPYHASLYRTQFTYDGSSRLSTISLPTPSAGSRTYTFWYNSVSGKLDSVGAPAAAGQTRTTRFTIVSGRLTAIKDPAREPVEFGYISSTNRIAWRRNRRDVEDHYAYDAGARVSSVTENATSGSPVLTGVQSLESRALVGAAVPATLAYTRVDGPRTDVADSTLIWLNGYGAARRVRDAMGHETIVEYGDANWPGISTRIQAMNGYVTRAWLSSTRPLIDSIRSESPYGDGAHLTTRYEWHAFRPLLTKSTGADGSVSISEYDSTGNEIAQQRGTNTDRRVVFGYSAALQLDSIREPGATAERLSYDASGNVRRVKSPAGRLALMFRDAIGRDTLSVTPTSTASATDSTTLMTQGQRRRVQYDSAGFPWRTVTSGPAIAGVSIGVGVSASAPAETLFVDLGFDQEGNPFQVTRYVAPDSGVQWIQSAREYDYANRLTADERGEYTYDLAGNQTRRIQNYDTVRTSYDALRRAVRRTISSKYFPQSTFCATEILADACERFPYYGSLRIERDEQSWRFDGVGNLVGADNRYARVSRTYYRNGQLATDTIRIRGYDAPNAGTGGETTDPADFSTYKYGMRFGYDSLGRRAWGGLTTSSYYYSVQTGLLDSLRNADGNRFLFSYDLRSRLTGLTSPGSVSETRSYDDDGYLLTREIAAGYGDVSSEALSYDGRGKVLGVTTTGLLAQNRLFAYSGLGSLIGSGAGFSGGSGSRTETFRVDALGNVYFDHRQTYQGTNLATRYAYEGGSDALSATESWKPTSSCTSPRINLSTSEREYDSGGSATKSIDRAFTEDSCVKQQYRRTVSRSYYSGEGKLRFFQRHGSDSSVASRSVYEEYRYDALGRRVMIRSRPDSNCTSSVGSRCFAHIERYVWDGDQLAFESRGSSGSPIGPTDQYGEVYYTHGGGIDQPLALKKDGSVIVPHANWRGVYESGTSSAGADLRLSVGWPGQEALAYLQTPNYEPQSWHGSLVRGSLDNSGLAYRRNRYYDPQTGRFTQQDPIGLAGGLNLYGYAGGDPINYWDPFGLEIVFKGEQAGDLEESYRRGKRILGARAGNGDADAEAALGLLNQMEKSKRVFAVSSGRTSTGAIGETDEAGNVTVDVELSREEPNTRLPFVVLHELGHSYTKALYGPNIRTEAWALLFENTARIALRWELRPDNHGYPKHVPKP